MDNAYHVVLSTVINNRLTYFEFDTCTEKDVTTTAQIPNFPVQSGAVVSDHMYREPINLTLSGTFSLNGAHTASNNDCFTLDHVLGRATETDTANARENKQNKRIYDFLNTPAGEPLKALSRGNRLTNIQTVFEYIQEQGLMCTIMMSRITGDDSDTRFKIRPNMVLQSVSWREHYNSMGYSMTFREVMQVDVSFDDTQLYSDLFPNTLMPASKSVGEVLQESGDLTQLIISLLIDNGYIAADDAKVYVKKLSVDYNAAVGATMLATAAITAAIVAVVAVKFGMLTAAGAVVAGSAGTAVATGVAATGSAIFPVGTVIVASAVIVAGTIAGITAAINQHKRAEKLAAGFNLINDYKAYIDGDGEVSDNVSDATINTVGLAKLNKFITQTLSAINKATSNIKVYQLSSSVDDNSERSFPLMVGDTLYYFTVSRNETVPQIDWDSYATMSESEKDEIIADVKNGTYTAAPYEIKIADSASATAESIQTLPWSPITDILKCASGINSICHSEDYSSEAYLIAPALDPESFLNSTNWKDNLINYMGSASKLCNYFILVSTGPIEDNMKDLSDALAECFETNGFKLED